MNIDSSFEEFGCNREKRNGTEAGGRQVAGMWGQRRTLFLKR